MDEFATHGLSCRMSSGRLLWHATINTIVKMSLARAQIPSALEPVGLCRSDSKRPDGATITPCLGRYLPGHLCGVDNEGGGGSGYISWSEEEH